MNATTSTQTKNIFIDFSIFMGMHSEEETTRISCKNLIIKLLKSKQQVTMFFQDVGKCDDLVWHYNREEQDAYYPFMDVLHTVMNIKRIPLTMGDVANTNKNLPLPIAVLQAKSTQKDTIVYSLQNIKDATPLAKAQQEEQEFPEELEKLYHTSLTLKIATSQLNW